MPRRVPKEVTAHRERIAWEMRLKMATQEQIAVALNVSQQAVSLMLERIETRLAPKYAARAKRIQMSHTAILEQAGSEIYRAWTRSQENADSTDTFAEQDGDGATAKKGKRSVRKQSKGQAGSAALFKELRETLIDIRKIWGVDAPVKIDHRHEFERMSDEELIAEVEGAFGGNGQARVKG